MGEVKSTSFNFRSTAPSWTCHETNPARGIWIRLIRMAYVWLCFDAQRTLGSIWTWLYHRGVLGCVKVSAIKFEAWFVICFYLVSVVLLLTLNFFLVWYFDPSEF